MSTVIQRMVKYAEKVEKLSDEKLADELLDHVWSDSVLGTYQEALLDEAIARLRGESNSKKIEGNSRSTNFVEQNKKT